MLDNNKQTEKRIIKNYVLNIIEKYQSICSICNYYLFKLKIKCGKKHNNISIL